MKQVHVYESMTICWVGLVHWGNEGWQKGHEKGNRKGKVNGLEVSNSLDMLGTFVLNVVHGVHR